MSRALHRTTPGSSAHPVPRGPLPSPSDRRSGRTRRTRLTAVATGAALLFAACGGGESSSDDGGDDESAAVDSPLQQLFGFGSTSSADQRAQQLEMEQAIAQCMQDEGWEYTPVDWQSQVGGMDAEWEEMLNDPEAYGEKYGYGVVRSYETRGDMSTGTSFEDPNMDYVNSLTPEENEAYYETLYGNSFSAPVEMSDGEEQEFSMPPLEEQGCSGRATLTVFGENSPMTNTEMQERLTELFEAAEDDPAIVAAEDAWGACMRDKDPSYDWPSPDEVSMEFWNRLSELEYGPMQESETDFGATEGTVPAFGGMPEIDEADLEELRQDELRTWRDDWDCQQEIDIARVRRDAEQRIVDEILAEFPELAGS